MNIYMSTCPPGILCVEKNTFILIALIISAILAFFYINNSQLNAITSSISKNKDSLLYLKHENNIIRSNNQKLEDKLQINNHIANEANYLANKDISRVTHPLVAPLRSQPYRINHLGIPVNVPTRGYSTGFQQMGTLVEYKDILDTNKVNDKTENKLLPLYGEQCWPGSRQWKYYTSSDGFQSVKLPIIYKNRNCLDSHGCDEIYDGQIVSAQGYNNRLFKVNLYKLDSPKYIPFIL